MTIDPDLFDALPQTGLPQPGALGAISRHISETLADLESKILAAAASSSNFEFGATRDKSNAIVPPKSKAWSVERSSVPPCPGGGRSPRLQRPSRNRCHA